MLRIKHLSAKGSNNFPNRVYENPPELIEWLALEMQKNDVKPEIEAFDLSHIFQAAEMYKNGQNLGKIYPLFTKKIEIAIESLNKSIDRKLYIVHLII